jgi:uncharacterized protein YcaQ
MRTASAKALGCTSAGEVANFFELNEHGPADRLAAFERCKETIT